MNTLASCITLSGTLPAGVLLFRMLHWTRFASILRQGEKWIVKYKAEWCEDTALSPQQHTDALARLKKLGLIEAEKHMWKGHALTFVRVKSEVILKVNSWVEDGPQTTPGNGPQAMTHITKKIHKGSTPSEIEQTPLPPSEVFSGEETMPTVEELMKAQLAKGPKPGGKKSAKPPIPVKWMQLNAEAYPGKFHKSLTQKQIGQLNLFKKACAGHDPYVVLGKVIPEWAHFAGTVKATAGIHNVPSEPNIDFLLKHVQVAVNYSLTPVAEPASAPKPKVQLIATKVKPKPKPEKASLEDVNKLLLGDGEADDGDD